MPTRNKDHLREYDRALLRSSVISLLQAVIADRKSGEGGYKLQQLADGLGVDKGLVSRWLSGDPNWRLNTLADVAGELGFDIEVTARERGTGRRFAPTGAIGALSPSDPTPLSGSTDNRPVMPKAPSSGRGRVRVEAA